MPWGEPFPSQARGVEPPFAPTFIRHERLSEDEFRRQRLGQWADDQPPFTITGDRLRDMANVVEGFDWCIVAGGSGTARRESLRRMEVWRQYRRDVLAYYKDKPMPDPDITKIATGARALEQIANMDPTTRRVANALDLDVDEEGMKVCVFCLYSTDDGHADDCAWAAAREVFPAP